MEDYIIEHGRIIALLIWLVPFVLSMLIYAISGLILYKTKKESHWAEWYRVTLVQICPLLNIVGLVFIIRIFWDYHHE